MGFLPVPHTYPRSSGFWAASSFSVPTTGHDLTNPEEPLQTHISCKTYYNQMTYRKQHIEKIVIRRRKRIWCRTGHDIHYFIKSLNEGTTEALHYWLLGYSVRYDCYVLCLKGNFEECTKKVLSLREIFQQSLLLGTDTSSTCCCVVNWAWLK